MRSVQMLLLAATIAGCAAEVRLWCRDNSHCQSYTNEGAVCQGGACVCSEESSPIAVDVPLCTNNTNTTFVESVRAWFPRPENCVHFLSNTAELAALRAAIATVAGGSYVLGDLSVHCLGDFFAMQVGVTMLERSDLLKLHTRGLEGVLAQELAKDQRMQELGLSQPVHVGVQWLDTLRCQAMSHATEMEYRYSGCVTVACEAGYTVYDDMCLPVASPVEYTSLSSHSYDLSKLAWCRKDADCALYGDTGATCSSSGTCQCSSPVQFAPPRSHGHHAPTCVPAEVPALTTTAFRSTENIIAVWGGVQACPSYSALQDMAKALTALTSGRSSSPNIKMTCASNGVMTVLVRVESASVALLLLRDLPTDLEAELAKDDYSAELRALGKAAYVRAEWVDNMQCKADHALTFTVVEGACQVQRCRSGYVVSENKQMCVAADDSDDDLSVGALVGIICGSVAFVVLVGVVLAWCMCTTRSKTTAPDDAGEPTNAHDPAHDTL